MNVLLWVVVNFVVVVLVIVVVGVMVLMYVVIGVVVVVVVYPVVIVVVGPSYRSSPSLPQTLLLIWRHLSLLSPR